MNNLAIEKLSYASVLAKRRQALRDELDQILGPAPASFVWEVGCGHGHFLNAYAAKNQGGLCIGVDIESSRITRAKKKQVRAKLTTVHFIRGEAGLFLEALPSEAQISHIFILFPDPWPKTRHHKHRLIQPKFLNAVAAKASADARLYFRTDHAPYFAAARALLEHTPAWTLSEDPWPFEFETVFQSRAVQHQSLVAKRRPI